MSHIGNSKIPWLAIETLKCLLANCPIPCIPLKNMAGKNWDSLKSPGTGDYVVVPPDPYSHFGCFYSNKCKLYPNSIMMCLDMFCSRGFLFHRRHCELLNCPSAATVSTQQEKIRNKNFMPAFVVKSSYCDCD